MYKYDTNGNFWKLKKPWKSRLLIKDLILNKRITVFSGSSAVSSSQGLILDTNNNVGIGVDESSDLPLSYKLMVSGSIKASGTVVQGSDIRQKEDIRTPWQEAEAFMKGMDKNGIEYEKMIIEKETHGFSKEENRIEKMKRISAFFNKYLDT